MIATSVPLHERVVGLRRHAGPTRELWAPLAECLGELADAERCLIALRAPGSGINLGRLADWTNDHLPGAVNGLLNGKLAELFERIATEGSAVVALGSSNAFGIGVRLPLLNDAEICNAILLLTGTTATEAEAAVGRLLMVKDIPRLAQERLLASQKVAGQQRLAETLEILTLVQDQTRFVGAAMALCNGLAHRFNCERVSLGWLRGPTIRLRAVSRTEKINRQMELAQGIEAVMEEAVDQEADLSHPASDESWITVEHARYSAQRTSPHLLTLLLRADTQVVGAVMLERSAAAWEEGERQQIRLVLDLVSRRFHDLEKFDRWFGARWAAWWKNLAGRVIGHRHTWAKLLGLAIFLILLVLIFWRLPYRVEGDFTLRAEQLAQLGAPFEGYIGQTYVRPGDVVTNQQPLLQLDIRDLVLEEAAADAELQRYQREMEKSRATGSLGEMRVAEALVRQGEARLAQLRNRLDQATIRSPFDGVVIEGDFQERLGQPIRQGDGLFRVARLDRLYIEADVPERDIHELRGGESGEVAFLSQPGIKFAITGRTLEPAAVPRNAGNVFLYRCELTSPPEPWFRPGMQGVAKVDVGRRRLLWILTHRTVNFLRLHLWW